MVFQRRVTQNGRHKRLTHIIIILGDLEILDILQNIICQLLV